jgi:hypothetical protein
MCGPQANSQNANNPHIEHNLTAAAALRPGGTLVAVIVQGDGIQYLLLLSW